MGHCCQDFALVRGGKRETVSEMRKELTEDPKLAEKNDGLVWLLDHLVLAACGDAGHYTCDLFDPVEKKCSRYEERPLVCRRYGTPEVPCTHPDCQWKDASRRRPEVTPHTLKAGAVVTRGGRRDEC